MKDKEISKKKLLYLPVQELFVRRARDSNPHRLSPGGFQDRCNTIMRALRLCVSNYKYAADTRIFKKKTMIAQEFPLLRTGFRTAFCTLQLA